MGGNCIRDSQRMTRAKYEELCDLLVEAEPTMKITRSFSEKETYGDIDCILRYNSMCFPGEVVESHKNGAVTSIGLKVNGVIRQVDYFLTGSLHKQEHLQAYLSYGIFGMCVGICVNKLGLEYGMDGLKVMFRGKELDTSILLSQSCGAIFAFLQLDYYRFTNGFINVNELFEYLFTSPYISYTALMKKVDKLERLAPLKYYPPPPTKEKLVAEDVVKNALSFFGKQKDYDKVIVAYEKKAMMAAKFNGNIVMELTSLVGSDLGKFISEFRRVHNIASMTPEDIHEAILIKYGVENIKASL